MEHLGDGFRAGPGGVASRRRRHGARPLLAGLALPSSPDLTIHRAYEGYWYFGHPSMEELRTDMRHIPQASERLASVSPGGAAGDGCLYARCKLPMTFD